MTREPRETAAYLCITGNYQRRMRDAIVFAERNRVLAFNRRDELVERAHAQLKNKHRQGRMAPPTDVMLDIYAETIIQADELYKLYVSNEQWGSRLGATYAAAHSAECAQETLQLTQRMLEVLSNLEQA